MLSLIIAAGLAASTPVDAPAWCSVPPSAAAEQAAQLAARLKGRLGEAPHALAHVHTEHTLSGDPVREASLAAERDLPLMRDAALAWRAGAGDAYGVLAARDLTAWLATYQPDLNPIDETGFDALIDTYALVQDEMPAASRKSARRYFTAWARAYVDAIDRAQESGRANETFRNNWQSHRVKLVTMMAVATNDPKLFDEARRLYWRQVETNIAPSGEVLDFRLRDALHYVVYDLEPLLQAALAARSRGEDWFHARKPGGASLEAAVRWLEPYASGEKPHVEFVHSTVPFDAERAQHGEKGYSGPFEPKGAAKVFWLAAQFDAGYRALAERLDARPPTFVALCGQ